MGQIQDRRAYPNASTTCEKYGRRTENEQGLGVKI
jgi:hypothetical protein